MAQNPLLGKRISLISKKNIRYEGVLYSINEENSTVALQNVKSYGTEGRGEQMVAASDAVHPYMVFRGLDIQDLHVHEDESPISKQLEPSVAPTPQATKPDPNQKPSTNQLASNPTNVVSQDKDTNKSTSHAPPDENAPAGGAKPSQHTKGRRRRNEVGTGASLLNVRPRGVVTRENDPAAAANFDFSAQNDAFEKDELPVEESTAYKKDNFFDNLSCEATDLLSGTDNRLRGHAERKLNTETFGAVALNSRWTGRGGRGRGRGRSGRGRREGRGRSGRGSRGASAQRQASTSES